MQIDIGKRIATLGMLVALIQATTMGYAAETYPAKPIRIVVPFPAGGNVDILTRIISERLVERLGQKVEVDPRPGGDTGTDIVADAAPDGYTLLMGHVTSARVFSHPPYDPLKHFEPTIAVATSPYILVAHPDASARSVEELVAVAKRNPAAVKIASSGNFGPSHLSALLFKTLAHVEVNPVLFAGNPPSVAALAKGEVSYLFTGLPATLPYIKAGKFRALAVTTPKRVSTLPNVPTMQEAGLAAYVYEPWYGLLAPVGTPPSIVARLNAEITKILQDPQVKARLLVQGFEPSGGTPQQFRKMIEEDIVKWRRVVEESGARVK